MIRVRVELLSAITGETTELARMHITNDGLGTGTFGNYNIEVLRGRCAEALDNGLVNKVGRVECYPRQRLHVWNLVRRALTATGYK